MAALSVVAMFFQDNAVATQTNDVHWIKWFVFIAAVGLVLQGIGVLFAAIYAAKLIKKVDDIVDHVDKKTTPILTKATALIEDITPKVHDITTNVQQVSFTVRDKVGDLAVTVDELNTTVQEINARARMQVMRVDGMVTEALDTTQEVSRTVQENVKKPIRQMAGIIAGLKTGLETLIARSPFKPRGGVSPYDL
jgi:methyl-accepting chemotaxis protein